jgi:gluconate 2-dehydrogenase gamma chain
MAGQSIERREVLRILALATSASGFAGFEQWVFAHDHAHARQAKPGSSPYKPQFFSADEYASVKRLAEMIIPSDGSPGAREAGASEFIDFIVASDPELQPRFRKGLAWMNAHATRLHKRAFADLSAEQQTGILEHLAYKDRHRPGEEEGQAFFQLMREYTVMGFYTSRVGLEELDWPGLQEYYAEMPRCPHPDDPEHRHLPPPKV